MTPSPPHSIFVKEEFWMTLIVHNVKFRLQEIYTKFSDLWNAKIDKKNMHKKKKSHKIIFMWFGNLFMSMELQWFYYSQGKI